MSDARELKDQAAKHFAKARFDKAASVYAELCALEPKDALLRIRLGDARAKAGDSQGAVDAYRAAAEDYARQGFLPRAIAACKLILEIDPSHRETQVALARLYTERSSPGAAWAPRFTPAPPVAPGPPAAGSGEASPELQTAPSRPKEGAAEWKPADARELPKRSPERFQFSELELGESELVDLEAAAARGATRGASCPRRSEVGPAPAAASTPLQAGRWLETPDGALSLAELKIDPVDEALETGEAEEIEVRAVWADRPQGAADLLYAPLFSQLSSEAFVDLVSRCGLRRAEPGETILEEGSVGYSFFAVSSGAVKVVRKRAAECLVLARLGPGEFFGEMALLSGAPRSASVVADEPSELLEISASLLADLLSRYPHVGRVLRRFCRERFLANVLSLSRIFAQFGGEDRRRLFERFQVRHAAAGERIVEEGRASDGLYVVVSGAFEVAKAGDGPAKLAELREGDIFGEISLLTKGAATATVAAVTRGALLRLPRQAFDELISTHPQVLELVSELTDERLRLQAERRGSTSPSGLTFL